MYPYNVYRYYFLVCSIPMWGRIFNLLILEFEDLLQIYRCTRCTPCPLTWWHMWCNWWGPRTTGCSPCCGRWFCRKCLGLWGVGACTRVTSSGADGVWNHFPGKAPSMLKVKFECENNIIVVFLSTSWSKWIQQLFNSIRSVIHRQGWQTELLTEFLPPRPSRKRRAARAMPQVSHMKGGRQSGVSKWRLRDIDIPIDNELETAHASYDPEGCLSLLEAAKGAP